MLFNRRTNAFIIGCSNMGAYIASQLSSQGYDVTIIDKNNQSFRILPDSYSGFKTVGNGTDFDFLDSQDIKSADIVLVSTDDDNVNCYIAQYLKLILKLPIVITRIYNQEKSLVLKDSGIKIIYPTELVSKEFFHVLTDIEAEEEQKKEDEKK